MYESASTRTESNWADLGLETVNLIFPLRLIVLLVHLSIFTYQDVWTIPREKYWEFIGTNVQHNFLFLVTVHVWQKVSVIMMQPMQNW